MKDSNININESIINSNNLDSSTQILDTDINIDNSTNFNFEDISSLSIEGANELNNFIEDKNLSEFINDKYLYKAPSKNLKIPLYLSYKEIFKLAQIVHGSLFKKYPILLIIFNYFKSIISVFNLLDLPIS